MQQRRVVAQSAQADEATEPAVAPLGPGVPPASVGRATPIQVRPIDADASAFSCADTLKDIGRQ